jgi:hypothetical protein
MGPKTTLWDPAVGLFRSPSLGIESFTEIRDHFGDSNPFILSSRCMESWSKMINRAYIFCTNADIVPLLDIVPSLPDIWLLTSLNCKVTNKFDHQWSSEISRYKRWPPGLASVTRVKTRKQQEDWTTVDNAVLDAGNVHVMHALFWRLCYS